MVLIQNHYNTIKLLYRKLVQPKRARSVPYLKNYLLANYSAGAYQSRAIAPKMSQTTTTAAGFWRHTPVCMAEPPNGQQQGHKRFRRWTAYWGPPTEAAGSKGSRHLGWERIERRAQWRKRRAFVATGNQIQKSETDDIEIYQSLPI